jgi:hypothetical protein
VGTRVGCWLRLVIQLIINMLEFNDLSIGATVPSRSQYSTRHIASAPQIWTEMCAQTSTMSPLGTRAVFVPLLGRGRVLGFQKH